MALKVLELPRDERIWGRLLLVPQIYNELDGEYDSLEVPGALCGLKSWIGKELIGHGRLEPEPARQTIAAAWQSWSDRLEALFVRAWTEVGDFLETGVDEAAGWYAPPR